MADTLVPMADGSEEMEVVIIVDILRRAGWKVTLAGVGGTTLHASRGIRIVADADWHALDPMDYDVLVLPGGMGGTRALCREESILETVRCFVESERLVGAICAGPLVLQEAGVLNGRRATCHPGVAAEFTTTPRCTERVVRDGAILTSQGPGTAMEFALALVAAVDGDTAATRAATGLILPR